MALENLPIADNCLPLFPIGNDIWVGGHGHIWVCPFRSQDSIICCISRMNELIELMFCMLIHGVRKAEIYFGYMHMVKYCCDLLGPGTLIPALSELKNKLMN